MCNEAFVFFVVFSLKIILSCFRADVTSVAVPTDTPVPSSITKRPIMPTSCTALFASKPSPTRWIWRATLKWLATAARIAGKPSASSHICRATWRCIVKVSRTTATCVSRTSQTWPVISSIKRSTSTCKGSHMISRIWRCSRIWAGTRHWINRWESRAFRRSSRPSAECMDFLRPTSSKKAPRATAGRRRVTSASIADALTATPVRCSITRTATRRDLSSARSAKRSSPI